MKFFLTLNLLTALILALKNPFSVMKPTLRSAQSPLVFLLPDKNKMIEAFSNPRHGRVFWGFLTGEKSALSPKLKAQFDLLELGFLFSPSGLHLSGFFFLWFLILRKVSSKKTVSKIKLLLSIACYFIPSLAIKRIVILRLLIFLKFKLKKKWSIEQLFLTTFLLSFFLGHYTKSPAGFVMSFLFMGTFISLSHLSRWHIILGLFTGHLLLAFYSGNEVSLLALILNIPLILYFTMIMAISGFFLASFQWTGVHWFESLLEGFLFLIKKCAKNTVGTHVNSSFFLIVGIWIFLLRKDKRLIVLCFLLHTNIANSPSFFVSGPWTQAPERSAGK